jgi:RHS repeat-associated protein
MEDSCYFHIDARRYRSIWEPAGFESPYVDKDWLQWVEIYESTSGALEETLIVRTKIVPFSYPPEPYEVATVEILGAGWYGYDAISIVAIPAGPDEDCETEGDPMHPRRGDMFIQTSDLMLSGRGPTIDLSRYYTSVPLENPDPNEALAWTSPFGFGWTHSCNIFLTLEGGVPFTGSNWSVRLRDRHRNYHGSSWYGNLSAYNMKRGDHSFLERHVSGNDTAWVLEQTDGKQYFFKKIFLYTARLDSIVDNNGDRLELTYNSNNNLVSITDAVGREITITYSGNRIKRVYEPPDISAPYLEYFYESSGGAYHLIRVEKHTNTDPDTNIVLDRYFYNSEHLMLTRVLPMGTYTESNESEWHHTLGDRVNFWYDSRRRLRYEEVVQADSDTLLTNDIIVYRAHFRYYENTDGFLDSTVIYYHEGPPDTGAFDPFIDNEPGLPTTRYYRKIIRYSTDGTVLWVKIHHPETDLSFMTTYGSYDGDYNSAFLTDPDNKTTYYTYHSYTDGVGSTRNFYRPTKTTYPTEDSVLYYYSAHAGNDRFFLVDSVYDELHRKTNYIYDPQGNLDTLQYYQRDLVGSETPQNVDTDFDYNTRGNLIRITDPEGKRSYFHYAPEDTGGFLTESRVDIGNDGEDDKDLVSRYRYNVNRGTMDTLIYYHDYPDSPIKIEYSYDAFGRLHKLTYPDSSNEEYIYDKRGNLLEKTVSKAGETYFKIQYEYDPRNHLIKVMEYSDLDNSPSHYDSTLYTYNLNDALIEFTNANNGDIQNSIHYDYTADRLIRTRYADATHDSLGYYLSGYLRFKRDRSGRVIDYNYDDRWRLTKKRYFDNWNDYPNHPSDSVVFWLDKIGNLDSLLDKSGKIVYDYDGLDRMFEVNTYGSKTVRYLYDKVSNRLRMKVCETSDTTLVYLKQAYPAYDEGNRLLKTVVYPDTIEFAYWDTGPVREITYPNDLREQYWLTSRNLIDSMQTFDQVLNDRVFKFDYCYNPLTDRDTLRFKIFRPFSNPLMGVCKYSYDDIKRITGLQTVIIDDEVPLPEVYTYDPVGNRLTWREGSTTTYYTYNEQTNQLMNAGPVNYIYDHNGNVTSKNSMIGGVDYSFDWDNENRLVKVRTFDTSVGDSLGFNYCGLGKRIRKIHYNSDDTTRYTYDGMYVASEFGNNDSMLSAYIYANGLLFARYDFSGEKNYYHHDALGSIVGLTDTNGDVVQSYCYDEFGNLENSWGDIENHYLYNGQEYDYEIEGTELYNLRARYYDPGIGRFISEDLMLQSGLILGPQCPSCVLLTPEFAPNSFNAYVYVSNNPVNFDDPTGMFIVTSPSLICLVKVYQSWINSGGQHDKFRHCFLGCTIFRYCGPAYCFAAGPLKELIDWVKRIFGKDEIVELSDVKATMDGCACGLKLSENCDYCCECLMKHQP